MPHAKKESKPTRQESVSPGINGKQSPQAVLTLSEAAAYLRLSDADVLRLVNEQGLPARRLGNEWRFLTAAINRWLSTPESQGQGIWAAAGALKGDPYLDEMLQEIERMRVST